MGLAWQQGPLGVAPIGHFLTAQPLPERLLFAEPLRRRMRVRLGDQWIADSEDVVLLHEPARHPVAYFPRADVLAGVLVADNRLTRHGELGDMEWYTVKVDDREVQRAAWQHTALPAHGTPGRERDERVTGSDRPAVSDPDKSLDFYCDRLGFTLDDDTDTGQWLGRFHLGPDPQRRDHARFARLRRYRREQLGTPRSQAITQGDASRAADAHQGTQEP